MDLVELSRRLENLIRFGTVHSVDHAARRCRVQSGKLVTEWLRWFEARAGETTTWNPPTIGEQCVVFSPSGEVENGMVIYGAPSDVIDTPSHDPVKHVIKFPDGAVFSYDHAASHLDISGIRSATVDAAETLLFRAGESVTFDTPIVHDTGCHTTDDLLTYNNGLAGYAGENGSTISGDIRHHDGTHEQQNVVQVGTGGRIESNGIVLDDHGHDSVERGGDISGGPVTV